MLAILYLTCCFSICNSLQSHLNNPQETQRLIQNRETHLGLLDNDKLFDAIIEDEKILNSPEAVSQNNADLAVLKSNDEVADIKAILSNLLSKVNDLERLERRGASYLKTNTESMSSQGNLHFALQIH